MGVEDAEPTQPQTHGRLGRSAVAVFRPITETATTPVRVLRDYRMAYLRGDLLAAVTVAMVAVPQSMAFAEIAGLGPAVGLYTMIVGAIVGGLFTSSRHLSIGPTNTMAILTLAAVALAPSDASPETRLTFAATTALLAGLLQIGFALARMGELVRYVSHSVIVGFSAGAGVLIAVKQVPAFLGVSLEGTDSQLEGLANTVHRLAQATDHPDEPALTVGVVSLVVALGCRKISKWIPAYLMAIVAGALIVWAMGWTPNDLRLVGDLPAQPPTPGLPPLDPALFRELLIPAAAIALVGMIEAYGIGKTLAGKSGDRLDANQEFVAQGITNTLLSVFRGMPATGSFSRTALSFDAGAKTSLACVFSGVLVAVIFLTLAPAARFIPMASIAAILFPIAYGLIDWRYARRLIHSNHADLFVCLGTFLATITISLELAVFVGVFLNVALYLRRARQVYVMEMLRDDASPTGLIERPLRSNDLGPDEERGVVFLQLEGNLFFAAADELQARFTQVLRQRPKAVILRLKRTHLVDATVMHVFEQFAHTMQQQGGHVLLCGVRPRMKQRMDEFGLTDALGEDHVFLTRDDLFGSAKRAIQRARELTGGQIAHAAATTDPANPADRETKSRRWAYDI